MDRTILDTPIGRLDLTVVDGALARLAFVDDDPPDGHEPAATASAPRPGPVDPAVPHPDHGLDDVVAALHAYFDGRIDALDDLRVASVGTPFQLAVWDALRRIPAGTTLSYRELAVAIGRPTAVRAVGQANGANPITVVVPCHRVVRHDGSTGGYAGGLDRKRWLLDHERRHRGAAG